ncbi:uncharacterized protein LOC143428668 [Xylocopa sonorina]|uniref:uncharacterized protein LOC143428668 n=1 Tax=Xylocopa sonorina TaxID=1818115 RepID=UPI00403B2437
MSVAASSAKMKWPSMTFTDVFSLWLSPYIRYHRIDNEQRHSRQYKVPLNNVSVRTKGRHPSSRYFYQPAGDSEEEIGDRTPSQFLCHMRDLAGTTVSDEFLRPFWSGRRPAMARAFVTAQTDFPLNKLAKIADQIHDGIAQQVASITPSSTTELLLKRLERLELEISEHRKFRSQICVQTRDSAAAARVPFGKRGGMPTNVATSKGPATSHLFVTDRATKEEVLIDTGLDLCVYPRTRIKGRIQMTKYQLCAANIIINIYGDRTINLNMGLRRAFPWSVIINEPWPH